MGYVKNNVSLKQLFNSKKTKEPSVKALRTRAEEGILVYRESIANVYYYDEQLSIIRALAARKCKRPGIRWKDISKALDDSRYTEKKIVDMLNQDKSNAEIIKEIAEELMTILL